MSAKPNSFLGQLLFTLFTLLQPFGQVSTLFHTYSSYSLFIYGISRSFPLNCHPTLFNSQEKAVDCKILEERCFKGFKRAKELLSHSSVSRLTWIAPNILTPAHGMCWVCLDCSSTKWSLPVVRNHNHGQLGNCSSKNCIHPFDRPLNFQLKRSSPPLVIPSFTTFGYLHHVSLLWFSFVVNEESRIACIPHMFLVLISCSNYWCPVLHRDHPGDLRWYFYRRLYLIKCLLSVGNSLSIKRKW